MRCINSIPAIVIAAVVRSSFEAQHSGDLLAFHALMVLLDQIVFKYFDDRSFVRLGGQQAISFQLTAPRGETRHSRPE